MSGFEVEAVFCTAAPTDADQGVRGRMISRNVEHEVLTFADTSSRDSASTVVAFSSFFVGCLACRQQQPASQIVTRTQRVIRSGFVLPKY